jgi:Protein of unknown function (DUF2721)
MHDISLQTPSLLFPAISLLMLAYTNRFVVLAGLVRKLHEEHRHDPRHNLRLEIANLRLRIRLIRGMQSTGIGSMLLCVLCMLAVLGGLNAAAPWIFGSSVVLLAASLVLALLEIQRSVDALDLHLTDLDKP